MTRKTILVIDDDPTILHLLQKKLTQLDEYDVLTAQDGKTGLEFACQHKPDRGGRASDPGNARWVL